jgi:diphthamide biosynthesis methyltransferase
MAGRYKKMKPMPIVSTDKMNTSIIKNEILDKTEKNENEKNEILNKRKTNNVVNIITAGQCLIRTKFYKIFNDKVIYEFYTDSIKRRIAYETLEKELQQGIYTFIKTLIRIYIPYYFIPNPNFINCTP